MKIQLSYVIILADDKNRCNIIHYSINSLKLVALSVIVSEIQALVLGVNYSILSKHPIKELIVQKIRLEAILDSKNVLNIVSKDG